MKQKRSTPGNIIVLATRNTGKRKEFETLLTPLGFEVKDLSAYREIPEVIEDGTTFEQNAIKKAKAVQEYINEMVLADDSGLCVDYLDGAPGVYSARYAGEPSNDLRNNEKLLEAMKDVPMEDRGAQFVCVLALVIPGKEPLVVRGECSGKIGLEPAGENGFGYDPLFFLPERGCTMAELAAAEKNQLSHRAKALAMLKDTLVEWT
jgi:non-canonical purine NTP pyrophosphatase (RdgB/HAM1 family)